MKLISVHIENFGKLSNFDLEFKEGLNTYLHDNGWGKTTLAEFIKVMFYGFENETKRTERERDKYRPWQGGVYGGDMVFEKDNKSFRLYRTFGLKPNEDTFKIIDTKSNLEVKDFTSNLGEEIFDIDSESFFKTIYLSQENSESHITNDLRAKMGGLSDATDDIGRYERADKALGELLNKNTFSRKTGCGKQLEIKLAEYRTEFDRYRNAEADLENAEELRNIEKKKEDHVLEEQKVLAKLEANVNNLTITDEERNLKIQIEKSGLENISETEIENDIEEWEQSEREYSEYQQKKGSLLDKLQELEKRKPVEPEKSTDKMGTVSLVFISVGMLTILLYFLDKSVILTALGVCLLAAGLIILVLNLNSNKKVKAQNNDYEKSFSEWEKEHRDAADGLDNLEKNSTSIKTKRDAILNKLNVTDASLALRKLYELKNNIKEYHKIVSKEEQYDRAFEEYRNAAEGIEIGGIREELDRLDNVIDKYDEQIDELEENIRRRDELKTLIAETEKKITQIKKNNKLIQYTKDSLSDAKDAFTQRFTEPVIANFKKYMNACGMTSEYIIDAHMDVSRQEIGQPRVISTQSRGLQDLQSFALRLSFSDCCYGEEKPFLIMDDPFTNMDDETVKLAVELLKALSQERQIIYFTCSGHRI